MVEAPSIWVVVFPGFESDLGFVVRRVIAGGGGVLRSPCTFLHFRRSLGSNWGGDAGTRTRGRARRGHKPSMGISMFEPRASVACLGKCDIAGVNIQQDEPGLHAKYLGHVN